ncbi:MAG: hypothetical protein P1V20_25665 [Verrucomicrobiales bacterium]|nr:hypothetical protein [Verrucomicrobiales bacterium]
MRYYKAASSRLIHLGPLLFFGLLQMLRFSGAEEFASIAGTTIEAELEQDFGYMLKLKRAPDGSALWISRYMLDDETLKMVNKSVTLEHRVTVDIDDDLRDAGATPQWKLNLPA